MFNLFALKSELADFTQNLIVLSFVDDEEAAADGGEVRTQ